MALLVQSGKHGAINTTYPATLGYYAVNYVSDAYTTAGEIVVKVQYLSCTKSTTTWYWEKTHKKQVIVIPTCTILNPCLDVFVVKYVQDIPRSICNRNQARRDLQRRLI